MLHQQHQWLLKQRDLFLQDEGRGKAFQHPVQELTIDQAKKWMNSLDAEFQRSTRQVAIYRADLNTYRDSKHCSFRGRLKREMHSRFAADLTEQGGPKAACFDFIMNGSQQHNGTTACDQLAPFDLRTKNTSCIMYPHAISWTTPLPGQKVWGRKRARGRGPGGGSKSLTPPTRSQIKIQR